MTAGQVGADAIRNELVAIKRLMVFGLLRSGATQDQVAKALGTSQSKISEMFSKNTGTSRRTKRAK